MAVRNDFTAGEVLAAADLNDTFASKVDYALPVNAQTGTTYTFVAADAEKLTTASNAAAVTLTIPPQSSVTWSDNAVLRVVNYGAGAVTIDGGSGVTVTNTSSTVAQYGAAVAIRTGSDAWTVVPFGGGDVPAAEVSSPAATGQYTDGGGQTWDYYTLTASGTLTVDTAGFADVLVVGGGGGGGSSGGGGGGAGGYLPLSNVYLNAGTVTVTVGSGGAANARGNSSAIGSALAVIGGGEGGSDEDGTNGGSGGGGGTDSGGGVTTRYGGVALFSGWGNTGGTGSPSSPFRGGGGGGASAAGASGAASGDGGDGLASSITGTSVTRAGGGGGGSYSIAGGSGGAGGGGDVGVAGTANTGGGGGGANGGGSPGAGGSGVVIVRVKV